MCNASNHPPGCMCGWGGFGHKGRRADSGSSNLFSNSDLSPRAYTTYVSPNANCPVCGVAVFFFQSSNGGRVFFDELGPPWPKHPCTNNRLNEKCKPSFKSYRWQSDGWSPFIISGSVSINNDLIKVSGSHGLLELTIYLVKSEIPGPKEASETLFLSLIQARSVSEGRFEISLLLPSLRNRSLYGYTSSIEAQNSVSSQPKRVKFRVQPRR
jgi:hypothetical protein